MENHDKILELAKDVLKLSKNTLLVNLRYLDAAISRLECLPIDTSTIMTDGKYILFNPIHVLKSYKAAKEIPTRTYLHMLMHCVFRHMFASPALERDYWNLACDIAVENVICELEIKSVGVPEEEKQAPFFEAIKSELKHVTAEKIYSYLKNSYPDPERLDEIRKLFCRDDHEIWYMDDEERNESFGLAPNGDSESNEMVIEDWQAVAERMQVDMETFGKERGDAPGSLTQNLAAVNREKYDYSAFLKKFAVMGEAMKINNDEFDYVFYTYGMELYGNMPLIEPLEYKDVKAIKEFVIAIDTSGSTSGELVQKFVQKTYNILKSTESFHSKINLHIIQCDTEIQEDIKITTQEEFDKYIETMQIHGLGGTDFRPVFEYVETLRKADEFTNLKGLIYFTDGCGVFPAKKTDYDTAFVFVEDDYNNYDVPPWAIKLILKSDEI